MNDNAKEQHALFKLNRDEFDQKLANLDINLEEICLSHLKSSDDVGILLVGSFAEGFATASSDVDLLVLVPDSKTYTERQQDVNLRSGRSRELLTYINGVEINVDFVAFDEISGLIESFIEISPALYDPTELKRIPLIEAFDLKFLHRLRTGAVLFGEQSVARWRDELMVSMLPMYLSLRHFFLSQEALEGARSAPIEIDGTVPFITRVAAEHAMIALLAHDGFTSQSKKFMFRWIPNIENQARKELAESGRELLFPSFKMSKAELETWQQRVDNFITGVETELRTNDNVTRCLDYLRAHIIYA